MVAASRGISIALTVGALIGAAPVSVDAVSHTRDDQLEARVWFDRGDEPLLRRGERVRVYYRSTEDAFVAILNIDTDGTTRLLFPRSPDENHYVRGGRDYRLIFPNSSEWHVEDRPGMGYFFIVTSRDPFDFSALRYSRFGGGWDMSLVSRQVYTDPYVAVDGLVAHLIPDWEYADYALDFATYHVDERQPYPRFLCYECHGFRPYTAWNPYAYSCTSFRVVIYDDPYYYPSYRYRGNRVVYSRPITPGVPRYQFKERADGEAGTPDIRRRATSRRPTSSSPQARRARPSVQREPRRADPSTRRAARPRSGAAGPARRTTPSHVAPTTRGAPTVPRGPASRSIPTNTRRGTGRPAVTLPPRAPRPTPRRGASSRPTTRVRPAATGSRPQTRRNTPPAASRRTPSRSARPSVRTPPKPKARVRLPSRSSGARARSTLRRPPTRKPAPRAASSTSRSVRKPVKRPPRGGPG